MRFYKKTKRLHQENIVVFIDAWSSFSSLYSFIKMSIPSKYGYIHYSYPNKILNSDPWETEKYFKEFINTVQNDLEGLEKIKPRNIYLYGQSLGGLFCMIISDKINVKKVMLVVPGDNLAESFWNGEGTQKLKNKMVEKYKINLPELKECWKDISPDFYFKNKSLNTDFLMIFSKKDNVIPIENGRKLINLLKAKDINLKTKEGLLPHRLMCIKEAIFLNNFKKWLSS